jgi:hypothetical protein
LAAAALRPVGAAGGWASGDPATTWAHRRFMDSVSFFSPFLATVSVNRTRLLPSVFT